MLPVVLRVQGCAGEEPISQRCKRQGYFRRSGWELRVNPAGYHSLPPASRGRWGCHSVSCKSLARTLSLQRSALGSQVSLLSLKRSLDIVEPWAHDDGPSTLCALSDCCVVLDVMIHLCISITPAFHRTLCLIPFSLSSPK